MRPALRAVWVQVHRWLALSLGAVLVATALLGALLTVARPLDQALHPELFAQPAGVQPIAAPLEQARRQLRQEFGAAAGFTLRPPREPGDTLWVFVRGPWDGIVYFDAAGREAGRRGEHEGWFNLLFELHSALLLGDRGKAVLATASASYVVLLVSGLVLWWPRRWPPSWRVERGAGALRTWLDLHKVVGSLLGLLLLVPVASGAYMAWTPLRGFVTAVAGEQPVKPPRVPAGTTATAPAGLDRLVEAARARFPDAMVGYVQVPASTKQAVRVRLKTAGEPHPNGLSSVWLDPASGTVLKVARWDELDAGSRLVETVYPLHIGVLGGLPHTVAAGLSGLALATLGASGIVLWWRRRAARAAALARTARGASA
jgi:uncharacterized iron-regulated membrane protein